jgi:hypothetical protein
VAQRDRADGECDRCVGAEHERVLELVEAVELPCRTDVEQAGERGGAVLDGHPDLESADDGAGEAGGEPDGRSQATLVAS